MARTYTYTYAAGTLIFDFEDEIKRFAKSYIKSNFENIIIEIENAISNVRNNVYTPLILTVLGIQIKKHLHRISSL